MRPLTNSPYLVSSPARRVAIALSFELFHCPLAFDLPAVVVLGVLLTSFPFVPRPFGVGVPCRADVLLFTLHSMVYLTQRQLDLHKFLSAGAIPNLVTVRAACVAGGGSPLDDRLRTLANACCHSPLRFVSLTLKVGGSPHLADVWLGSSSTPVPRT